MDNKVFGSKLKENRVLSKKTVSEVSEYLTAKGYKASEKTIYSWESGRSQPTPDALLDLCRFYGIGDVLYAFGYKPTESAPEKHKSAEPKEDTAESISRRYRALDSHGKQVVCAVMTEEERRIKAVAKEPVVIELFPMRHYIQSASAGLGDFSNDDSFEVVDLVKRPPAGASFLATVNGDSMEPTYHDGQWVFIRAQETLQYGEIGLFAIGADLYIKEYGVNGLISHNPAYAVRQPPVDTPARIYGKVLGVCSGDYFR